MIDFHNISFIKSTTTLKDAPTGRLKEILIVGRSNVGKSSLINAISERKSLAFTSSKPGHTKVLNYYEVDHKFYLVDAPGYGFAKGGVDLYSLFSELMDSYLENNNYLQCVLLLIDSRREFNDFDDDMLSYFIDNKINHLIVMTKSDKLNQSDKAKAIKHLKEKGINDYLFVSINNKREIDEFKKRIELLLKY